jgi:hypothetical protein
MAAKKPNPFDKDAGTDQYSTVKKPGFGSPKPAPKPAPKKKGK